MVCQVWTSLKLNASYTIKVSKTHGIVLAIHDRPSWGSHCGNWAVTQDSTATQAFSQGFTLKKVWKISKRRGISAAWDGAQAHVKNTDGDSVGSCPLEQDRRYHRKEVWKKKKSCCYMGWILALGRTGVGNTDYFPIFAKAFCLAWGKTIIFCPNFLLSKIFYTFASGGEEMMLEGNIFSITT